jgi:hypothetical protein
MISFIIGAVAGVMAPWLYRRFFTRPVDEWGAFEARVKEIERKQKIFSAVAKLEKENDSNPSV